MFLFVQNGAMGLISVLDLRHKNASNIFKTFRYALSEESLLVLCGVLTPMPLLSIALSVEHDLPVEAFPCPVPKPCSRPFLNEVRNAAARQGPVPVKCFKHHSELWSCLDHTRITLQACKVLNKLIASREK